MGNPITSTDFQALTIEGNSTVESAMLTIDTNRHRCLIVVDGRKVIGTLSDGDIRRAILDRRVLSTPVSQIMNTNFISLTDYSSGEATRIFEKEHIPLIPVIDHSGFLVEIICAF